MAGAVGHHLLPHKPAAPLSASPAPAPTQHLSAAAPPAPATQVRPQRVPTAPVVPVVVTPVSLAQPTPTHGLPAPTAPAQRLPAADPAHRPEQ